VTDPRQAPITVEPFVPSQRAEVEAVLARAFWPDPLFGHFCRDLVVEHTMLPRVFAAFMADALPFDTTWVARSGTRVMGAAVWVPPVGMPRSKKREAMMQARMARILITGRNRRSGLALLDAVDKVHPHDPHWYLMLLGTDPLVQGKGAGGLLLQPALERADAEGLPCYLETQKERNLSFYARYGFEQQEKLEVPGAPPVWTMRREAR
jgi:GNAT superfamily N-acetyltransferase